MAASTHYFGVQANSFELFHLHSNATWSLFSWSFEMFEPWHLSRAVRTWERHCYLHRNRGNWIDIVSQESDECRSTLTRPSGLCVEDGATHRSIPPWPLRTLYAVYLSRSWRASRPSTVASAIHLVDLDEILVVAMSIQAIRTTSQHVILVTGRRTFRSLYRVGRLGCLLSALRIWFTRHSCRV